MNDALSGKFRSGPSLETFVIERLQTALQKFTVFRYPTTHTLPPKSETRGLEFTTHDIDHFSLCEAGALFDFLEAGPILPSKSDHQRDLIGMDFELHGI